MSKFEILVLKALAVIMAQIISLASKDRVQIHRASENAMKQITEIKDSIV